MVCALATIAAFVNVSTFASTHTAGPDSSDRFDPLIYSEIGPLHIQQEQHAESTLEEEKCDLTTANHKEAILSV